MTVCVSNMPGSWNSSCKSFKFVLHSTNLLLEKNSVCMFIYYNYFRSLTLSQLDAGLKEDATKTCTRAIQLANRHVPSKLIDLVRLQVRKKLVEREIDTVIKFDLIARPSPS